MICVLIFRYFRHGTRYGLACLARFNHIIEDDGSPLSIIPQSQRGLRIKSIGILTSSIHNIHAYVEHLQAEAKYVPFLTCCSRFLSIVYFQIESVCISMNQQRTMIV